MEEWRDIEGFPGYQVSNEGRVRTFWKKRHYPKGYGTYRYLGDEPMIMSVSDDGNGYMKLMLYSKITGRRHCKKVHKLVADAFLPRPHDWYDQEYTVDHREHGPSGKLNNSVSNLQWMSRSDNIKKAYREGLCNDRILRQNKPVVAINLLTGDKLYFGSIKEASYELGIDRTAISHILIGDYRKTKGYTFVYADGEGYLSHETSDY